MSTPCNSDEAGNILLEIVGRKFFNLISRAGDVSLISNWYNICDSSFNTEELQRLIEQGRDAVDYESTVDHGGSVQPATSISLRKSNSRSARAGMQMPPPASPAAGTADWRRKKDLIQPIEVIVDESAGGMEICNQPSTSSSVISSHADTQQDAKVYTRIGELRSAGLWSATRLPMCVEPPRPKLHWDFFLEEVIYMSNDFRQERIVKRRLARKLCSEAKHYWKKKFDTKKDEKVVKEKEAKRVCASVAKMVKEFWLNVDKVVDFRTKEIVESQKRKALDQHLSFLVGEADKLSTLLHERLATSPEPTQLPQSSPSTSGNDRESRTPDLKKANNHNSGDQEIRRRELNDIAEVASEFQPKGNTLETTQVKTEVPFLLRGNLREYQLVGLDWLVTLYEKDLNGILADEMGLGKTIQTVALLAHLACEKMIWGPHLIIVPTSVILNWEMEFKKWCPALKILTYFGSSKERADKRKGWTKNNAFHVCITSYKIASQDIKALKSKSWQYVILDEAQNIKNFKSQRWQTLLNIRSRRRLLLTGTPLQNSLMELWSLLHFLMPAVFTSHEDFKDWFSNPMNSMVEGSTDVDRGLVQRLHKVLRPFILRRLKTEVERQLPTKQEKVIPCALSTRQRFLYNEFLSRKDTRDSLQSSNMMSVLNVIMQLRKCCNHPNLFEPRPVVSPLVITPLRYSAPSIAIIDSLRFANSRCDERDVRPSWVAMQFNAIGSVNSWSILERLSSSEPKCRDVLKNRKVVDKKNAHLLYRQRREEEHRRIGEWLTQLCQAAGAPSLAKETIELVKQEALQRDGTVYGRQEGPFGRLCEEISMGISDWLRSSIRSFILHVDKVFCDGPYLDVCLRAYDRHTDVICEQVSKQIYAKRSQRDELIRISHSLQFPELRLIEYDCGKLQTLSKLLKQLYENKHRCLIFTQMSRMLDILQAFLSYYSYKYFRLDGSTHIDQRQAMMERFNNDSSIFCFILSTRSGGVGVNLTGADTVIFYDSDWNPTMDAQAQDRCHRIGQTRNVTIYRLISEKTIEENILKKANQKRRLGEMALDEAEFTPDFFRSADNIRDLFSNEESVAEIVKPFETGIKEIEQAMANAEDQQDVLAAQKAQAEASADVAEFQEGRSQMQRPSSSMSQSGNRTADDQLNGSKYFNDIENASEQYVELISSMTPVERYAIAFLENEYRPKLEEEMKEATALIEAKKEDYLKKSGVDDNEDMDIDENNEVVASRRIKLMEHDTYDDDLLKEVKKPSKSITGKRPVVSTTPKPVTRSKRVTLDVSATKSTPNSTPETPRRSGLRTRQISKRV